MAKIVDPDNLFYSEYTYNNAIDPTIALDGGPANMLIDYQNKRFALTAPKYGTIGAGVSEMVGYGATGGDTPSVRNVGSGSTTQVNSNVTVNINGLPNTVGAANSTEIRVHDRSQIDGTLGITTTEFAGVGTENHTSTTYTFSVSAGSTFDVRVVNLDYIPLFLSNQTASTDPTNIPVDLKLDRVYFDDTPPSGD